MSYYRECPQCHAHLDPGERCDCAEPPRAKCPYFRHRADYMGCSSIVCGQGKRIHLTRDHDTRALRDDYYQDYCCDHFEWCPYYKAISQILSQMGLGAERGLELGE